ncbi:MAG TPA: hypothetical protein VLA77_01875 [Candidatus Saccharimonadales bacterium]|nr:hypothetical protein [Candidatus Saccharimonadales bacterium]
MTVMLKYAKKSKYLNVKFIERLEYITPYFLFDLKKIDSNYNALKKHLTNFTISTANIANVKFTSFADQEGVR